MGTTYRAALAALAVGASCMSMAAVAQDAAAPGAEQGEIVVNGYIASLAKARELKRASNITKDVIVAEDMAKFPELNLAE